MRIRLVRRPARTTHLIEIVAPRTGAALLAPAEHLFANCALGAPLAVEIAATATARRFLVRAGDADLARAATDEANAHGGTSGTGDDRDARRQSRLPV